MHFSVLRRHIFLISKSLIYESKLSILEAQHYQTIDTFKCYRKTNMLRIATGGLFIILVNLPMIITLFFNFLRKHQEQSAHRLPMNRTLCEF
jgi:hypothetical protein